MQNIAHKHPLTVATPTHFSGYFHLPGKCECVNYSYIFNAFLFTFTWQHKQSPVERRNILGRHELLTLDNLIVFKAKC